MVEVSGLWRDDDKKAPPLVFCGDISLKGEGLKIEKAWHGGPKWVIGEMQNTEQKEFFYF